MSNILDSLSLVLDQDVFVYAEPAVLNFIKPTVGKIYICSKTYNLEIPLSSNETELKRILSALICFFDNEKRIVLAWDLKNLLTFALGKTGVPLPIQGKIYDLSILESYFGEKKECPKSFLESFSRLSVLTKKSDFKSVFRIYQTVYLPLIASLPRLETCGMADKAKRARVYSHYEINGQLNGRMKCLGVFGLNAHTLSEVERENLRPLDFHQEFLSFDFRHQEVTMLQWLSGDSYIGEILLSGNDFYETLWEDLTKQKCEPQHRQRCKDIFLPVVYGMGSYAMSQQFNWPLTACEQLIGRLEQLMPAAFKWVKNVELTDGMAVDYYGRRRKFDEVHKIRNFKIQSPAALVCLHKLSELMEAFKQGPNRVAMSIHDGYVLLTRTGDIYPVYRKAKAILESEHELYPGLRMKVECYRGKKLSELIKFRG